jgi:hypothetical protein
MYLTLRSSRVCLLLCFVITRRYYNTDYSCLGYLGVDYDGFNYSSFAVR